MHHSSTLVGRLLLAAGLGLLATTALAQDQKTQPAAPTGATQAHAGEHAHAMEGQPAMRHGAMRGNGSMHRMTVTVTSVDKQTGMVEVSAHGNTLRVHFPPPSVQDLAVGEAIILHLGYTRAPTEKAASTPAK